MGILDTLATSPIPPKTLRATPDRGINRGASSYRFSLGGIEVIAKTPSGFSDPRAEVAAYVLSTMFPGLVNVPETVLRSDPDNGEPMSVQRYLPGATFLRGWHSVVRSDIVGLAAFDYIISNPDRHVENFIQVGTRLYAIDHGLTFRHFEVRRNSPNARVQGRAIPAYIRSHMRDRLLSRPTIAHARLDSLIGAEKVNTVLARADKLATLPNFPLDPFGGMF